MQFPPECLTALLIQRFTTLSLVALTVAPLNPALAQDAESPSRVKIGQATLFSSAEGQLQKRGVAGKTGYTATTEPRFIYGDIDATRSPNLQLEFDLHDGGYRGDIEIRYDSSDETVQEEPNRRGAWKRSSIKLEGKNTWTTVQVRWPDARLAKRCNGHDFRLHLPRPQQVVLSEIRVRELAPVAAAAPAVEQISFAPARAEGALIDGDTIRIPAHYVQTAAEPIVMNAADANVISMTAGKVMGGEGNPAGGRYIHFVSQAKWKFTVTTPGTYQLWQRGWFPIRGYNHEENVDGKQRFKIIDTLPETPLNQWTWVKAGRYELSAGEHEFETAYPGGERLDRLVWTRDLDTPPQDAGPPLSRNIGGRNAIVETGDVQPLDVENWLQWGGEFTQRGGTVRVELSTDGGATWLPATADKSLRTLKTAGGGKDRVRLRLHLEAGPDGVTPIVQGLAASYKPGKNNKMVLANSRIEFTFGPAGLRGVKDVASGVEYLHGGVEAPLWQLLLKPPGEAEATWVTVGQAAVLSRQLQGGKLTQRYRLPSGIEVTATVTLQGNKSQWGLDIDNKSKLEVCAATYPYMRGVRVGDDSTDDTLMLPTDWRQIINNPVEAKFFQDSGIRNLFMHWTTLYDERGGLYLGDHNWPYNDLTIWVTRDDPTSMNYGFTREFLVAPGQRRDSANYVLGVLPGKSWHAGADIYREWAKTHLKRLPTPAWVQRMDGWFNSPSDSFPTYGLSRIPASHDRALARGMGYFMGGNRAQIDGPIEYVGLWPVYCPAYGSLSEFQDMHREMREMGGHANWYMNWQLFSPSRQIDRQRIAGVIPRSWVEHPVAWPDKAWYDKTAFRLFQGKQNALGDDHDEFIQGVASPTWQKHQRDAALLWSNLYGSDGTYYDQLSVQNSVLSIDPEYNSLGDYGVWNRASATNLARIVTEARATNPHFVISGELANDLIGTAATFHMTSGVINRLEMLRYCVPDQILLDGWWNGGINEWTGSEDRWRYIWMVGARFEGLRETPYNDQLLALRRRVSSLLYAADFRDTVGLELSQDNRKLLNPPQIGGLTVTLANDTSGQAKSQRTVSRTGVEAAPAIGPQAKWFVMAAPNRGAIINVAQDPTATAAAPHLTISVPTADFGSVKVAWALNLDGTTERLQGTQTGGRFSFKLPGTQKATTVLLVNEIAPQIDLDLPFAAAPGSTVPGQAFITNFGAASTSGALRWQTPGEWGGTAANFQVGSGATQTVPVQISLPSSAKMGRFDLMALAETKTGEGRTLATSFPHWISATQPLWVRLEREVTGQITATIFNRSDKPLSGMLSFEPLAGVRVASSSQPFQVQPWAKTQLRTEVAGLDRLQKPVHLVATATAGMATARRSLMLYPTAVNGDFENDSAGDNQPDYWYAWGEGDSRGFSHHIALDATNPHRGKWSARLDPHPDSGKEVYATPIIHTANGGSTYRVRVAIKKTAATDNVALECGGKRLTTETSGAWSVLEETIQLSGGAANLSLRLYNGSRNPAWFDTLHIEKVG